MSSTKKGRSGQSRPRSILGLILAIIGLWFGFVVLNLTGKAVDLGGGEKALRIVFGIVWFTFWIGAIVMNVLNLYSLSRSKTAGSQTAASPTAEAAAPRRAEESSDFETKLRKLESLKRDGLVSEEEYQRKRDEFMRDKW